VQVGFAGAQRGELVRRDGSGTVAVNKPRIRERYGRAAQECAPTLLVFSGSLAECQAHGGVLGDLLGQVGFDARQIGQALSRQDTHHASFTRACE